MFEMDYCRLRGPWCDDSDDDDRQQAQAVDWIRKSEEVGEKK